MKTTWMTPLARREMFGPLFGDLFDDFWALPTWMPVGLDFQAIARPLMDVRDRDGKFEIKVDLPGVRKEDIVVTIEGHRVMINAETKAEKEVKDGQEGKEADGDLIRNERTMARYARTFELPVEVDEAGAGAVYENGVLTLTLPKHAAAAKARLAIQ